jgi:hypothetical protein
MVIAKTITMTELAKSAGVAKNSKKSFASVDSKNALMLLKTPMAISK